jgi:hypothetical protein
MIKLKGLGTAEELNGFMDEGTEFLGELRFHDTFRVDGRLRGRILSDNTLVVGESGRVEADIDCGIVSIRGQVVGHRAAGRRARAGHAGLAQAGDRGRGVLPGRLRDGAGDRPGGPPGGRSQVRPRIVCSI